jgi:hypothetical protein
MGGHFAVGIKAVSMEAPDRWGGWPHKRTFCVSHRFTSPLSDYEVPSSSPSDTCHSVAQGCGNPIRQASAGGAAKSLYTDTAIILSTLGQWALRHIANITICENIELGPWRRLESRMPLIRTDLAAEKSRPKRSSSNPLGLVQHETTSVRRTPSQVPREQASVCCGDAK